MTSKKDILQDIRKNCLDCTCNSHVEVRKCLIKTCHMYPYRFGTDPEPAKT